jgi:2-polyprenyl-3-methyl-5-hydroxy-6-metoxy-1,4-benzoquinol methylase
MNFKQRSNEKELMDGTLSKEEWVLNLNDLAWINRYLFRLSLFTRSISALLKSTTNQPEPITLADFACGDGAFLRAMALWAEKQALPFNFFGYDTNPILLEHALDKKSTLPLVFENQDVLSTEFAKEQFDIITCSLFCHHLTNAQLINFFQQVQKQARMACIINDLHRHWLAYVGFYIISWLKGFSPITRYDGLLSIRRGFTKKELIALLQAAGIKNYQIKWCFPFHYKIIIYAKSG